MDILPLIAMIGAVILTLFLGRGWAAKKRRGPQTPPKNTAADAARETVQQTFAEQVTGIKADAASDDAAERLALRGNARKRRQE